MVPRFGAQLAFEITSARNVKLCEPFFAGWNLDYVAKSQMLHRKLE